MTTKVVTDWIKERDIRVVLDDYLDRHFTASYALGSPKVKRRSVDVQSMGTAFNFVAYRIILEKLGRPLTSFGSGGLSSKGFVSNGRGMEFVWEGMNVAAREFDVDIFDQLNGIMTPFSGGIEELATRSFFYAHLETLGRRQLYKSSLALPVARAIAKGPDQEWCDELLELAELFRSRFRAQAIGPLELGAALGERELRGDADLLLGKEIIDFKTADSEKIDKRHLRQVLVYALLAERRSKSVDRAGIYYSRHGSCVTFEIDKTARSYRRARNLLLETVGEEVDDEAGELGEEHDDDEWGGDEPGLYPDGDGKFGLSHDF